MSENKDDQKVTSEDENKETEVKEEPEQEDLAKQIKTKGIKSIMTPKTAILFVGAVVIGIMCVKVAITGGGSTEKTCTVIQSSPYGQGETQSWYSAKTEPEAKAIGGYDITYPESIDGYDTKNYVALTKQVMEVRYSDADSKEVARITKAYICGNNVFGYLYIDETEYPTSNVVEVDGIKVTEKGDGETVTAAEWIDGDYSYAIGLWNNPLTKEEIEEIIKQVK